MSRLLQRWAVVIAATVVVLGAGGTHAGAEVQYPEAAFETHFFAADTSDAGVISLYFFGARGAPVRFHERIGNRLVALGTRAAPGDPTVMKDAVNWRCDRLERNFVASSRLADGKLAVGEYSVRTPSCATRLELRVPRRLEPGAVGRIRVIDRWGNGGVAAQLCIEPPGASRTCREQRLRRAVSATTRRFRATMAGRWRIELRFRGHRVRRSVAVGAGVGSTAPPPTVLTTGDSTMQGIDTALADELGDDAKVQSDVRPGSGLAKPFGPWATLPRRQTKRLRQAATIVSLGVVDGFPVTTPSGAKLACCGAGWVAEYTRRVRAAMQTYRRRGRARVLWLTLPIPRGSRDVADAVNRAVVLAAQGLSGVTVLRMDLVFSPTGFSDTVAYRGRILRVREEDGIHLNITGLAIAAQLVAAQLRKR